MNGDIEVVDWPAERRQIGRPAIVLTWELERLIDWNALADIRRRLQCDMHVTQTTEPNGNGNVVVEFSWPYVPEQESA
jgi:hypothetical protein